jgi:3-isopropylmalate/(R)-2-methylmalate dehydratase small subunit
MDPFTSVTSRLIPLPHHDVDTDQIIPARYLKVTDRAGLADGLFYGWRYRSDGSHNPDFALNRPEYQGARLLLAGDNFGCGSSREHAPWALAGWGIRAILAASFADIFRNNALKNGLLPVIIDAETGRKLFDMLAEDPTLQVTVDLASQTVRLPDGTSVEFPIDGFSKVCLLEGIDQLGYLMRFAPEIADYERKLEGSPA